MARIRTIRRMIRRAIETAIQSDTDLIACMGGDTETEKDVAAYRKILLRYFGSPQTAMETQIDGMKAVSIWELIEGATAEQNLDEDEK